MTTTTAGSHAAAGSLSKAQTAYQWIKERISTQEFAPGYRLVLSTIATDLDMSVVPVREAIRQLEAEGLVTFTRNVGAHVSMVDPSRYRASMESLGVLEGAATAMAAPHIRAEDLARAKELNARMEASLDSFDPHEFTETNHLFHSVLFDRCPNERLNELVNAEWERLGHLRDSTFTFVPERARESVQEHTHILTLIESGAPAQQIEQAAREHRTNTLRSYLNSQEDPRA
ncbi:GntR family transcriptional regulator [Kocuria sp.]|uniref:GntR family transcriptional regulator n=1 Tax=Kocuria sp. TaxID=1871328 RepID=UPI0026E069BB|nr:GntR family transcriptional regulator [Kocuria sp.]MDO5619783.1 GntR family transcriptional regulator [Kocuria sp.]